VAVSCGEVIKGEDLMLSFIYTNGKVSAVSDNKNYKITVIEGDIVVINSLSSEGFSRAFSSLLLIATVLLLIIALITRRADILKYVCGAKNQNPPEDTSDNSGGNVDEPNTCDGADSNAQKQEVKENEEDNQAPSGENGDSLSSLAVDVRRADQLITNSLARSLLHRTKESVITNGSKRRIVNVDTLSKNFSSGEVVDVNALKERAILPRDTAYVKVLARGSIDKPLRVKANSFSLSAVKMIALTGGEAIRVITERHQGGEEK